MTAEQRCEAIKEMLEPCGYTIHWNGRDSQREPGFGIVIKMGERGPSMRSFSSDSLEIAVARMEQMLNDLQRLSSHAYFVEPHQYMGTVGRDF